MQCAYANFYFLLWQHRRRGKVTAARDKAKARSLSPTYNPLWDLPYGDNSMGIFGATPPELLHQYGLGVEMYAFKFVWEMLSRYAAEEEGRAPGAFDQRLDDRFMAFSTRHADADMPRFGFTTGTKKLPYLTSGEYRALMYQMIVCLGTEGGVLPLEQSDRVTAVLWKVVNLHEHLWEREGHTVRELIEIDKEVKEMLTAFKNEFQVYSKSACRFPKFHYTLHLTEVIEEFGSLRVVDTSFGENKNKVVKKIHMRTNRKRSTMNEQMLKITLERQQTERVALQIGKNQNRAQLAYSLAYVMLMFRL